MSKHLPFKREEMPDRSFRGTVIDGRLVRGIELFNKKEYYDCHEVIEDLWLETVPEHPLRDLYKGIIQAAAAIYQQDRGIESGALGLYRSSVGYLGSYGPEALGVDIQSLVEGVHLFFRDRSTRPVIKTLW